MKLRMFFRVLVSLVVFSTSLAYGAKPTINLWGLWEMALDKAEADNDPSTYTFFDPDDDDPKYKYFVISSHEQNLFKGYACTGDSDIERSYFSGVINGDSVWITSWDSVTIGTIDRTGTEMSFVNMLQSLEEDPNNPSVNKSATSSGVATRKVVLLPHDPVPYEGCP